MFETPKDDMNSQRAKEKLFSKEKIECTRDEYHRDVRFAIDDYHRRMEDIGNAELSAFCKSELERLDALYGRTP